MSVGADCERHHNRIETADGLGMTHVTMNERYTP
jgi:hypothetical protein